MCYELLMMIKKKNKRNNSLALPSLFIVSRKPFKALIKGLIGNIHFYVKFTNGLQSAWQIFFFSCEGGSGWLGLS